MPMHESDRVPQSVTVPMSIFNPPLQLRSPCLGELLLRGRLVVSICTWITCLATPPLSISFPSNCDLCNLNLGVGWQRFAAVIMRIREPKTTALIFASGKMVQVLCKYQ